MVQQPHTRLCFLGHLELRRVEPRIQQGAAAKTGGRSRGADVLEHDFVAGQRFAGPIGAYQVEHAVFDGIPLGGSRRIVADRDRQAKFISQVLQAHLPGPTTVTVCTSAVGFDGQPRHAPILALAHPQPPRTDGTYCKSRRLMRGADHDIACFVILVIDAIRVSTPSGEGGKVVVQHVAVLAPPSTPAVLEVAHQLLFLRVHADYGPTLPLESSSATPQEAKLLVAVWVLFSAQPLAVGSQRVLLCPQQSGHGHMACLHAPPPQSNGQLPGRLVRPPQPSHRVASRCIPQQLLQQLPHTRRFFSTHLRPPPGRRTRSENSACPRSLSRNPRRIVIRFRPVISATCWMPPCLCCLANIPANNRRPRSSSSAITRLMARWYTTNSVSLRDQHPRQRQRWIRLRPVSAMTVSPSLEVEQADY